MARATLIEDASSRWKAARQRRHNGPVGMSLIAGDSPHRVRERTDLLDAAIDRRGVIVFARIDHGAGARAAGLELADEEVLLFGDHRRSSNSTGSTSTGSS